MLSGPRHNETPPSTKYTNSYTVGAGSDKGLEDIGSIEVTNRSLLYKKGEHTIGDNMGSVYFKTHEL